MSFLPLSAPPSAPILHPPTLLPSPLPDPSTQDPTDDDYDHDPQAESPSIPPPPNFQPLFTLLSNTGTSTTHHPNVYYVFSDDAPDTDPVTAAALQVLHPASATASPTVDPRADNLQPRQERYVLLDMDATGTKVESAQSMSPDWAVTSTELGPAPTWDRDGEGKQEGHQGRDLMLRVEGMDARMKEEGGRGNQGEEKRLEELVEVYERQMAELRRVVDAGPGVIGVNEG
ncbi:MAG: hypothetical protein ASARMPRED_002365 [Alectoria sarmentosa]|nr:MAG: hypothetical protein ASARMPRED_002365 [Alectoria sarmentosa]